jgi:hypothetical protein
MEEVEEVEVFDESLVPDEFCTVTVTMTAKEWYRAQGLSSGKPLIATVGPRTPSLSLIGEALTKPCGKCGNGKQRSCANLTCQLAGLHVSVCVCPECGGTGRQSVPGARLVERGSHVECK